MLASSVASESSCTAEARAHGASKPTRVRALPCLQSQKEACANPGMPSLTFSRLPFRPSRDVAMGSCDTNLLTWGGLGWRDNLRTADSALEGSEPVTHGRRRSRQRRFQAAGPLKQHTLRARSARRRASTHGKFTARVSTEDQPQVPKDASVGTAQVCVHGDTVGGSSRGSREGCVRPA